MPFWQFFRKADMALFNPCMKIKKFGGQMYAFEVVNNSPLYKFFIKCFWLPPSDYLKSIRTYSNIDLHYATLTWMTLYVTKLGNLISFHKLYLQLWTVVDFPWEAVWALPMRKSPSFVQLTQQQTILQPAFC